MSHPLNHSKTLLFLTSLLCIGTSAVFAQESGSHRVSVGIAPISVMAIVGDVAPLVVYRNDDNYNGFVRGVSTYNLTTNIPNVYIEATLDSPMPDGTSLWLTGESTLGKSVGRSKLDADRYTKVVSNIDRGLENGRTLAFRFVVTNAAKDLPIQSRNVTISLVDEKNGRREDHTQTVFFGVINTDAIETKR